LQLEARAGRLRHHDHSPFTRVDGVPPNRDLCFAFDDLHDWHHIGAVCSLKHCPASKENNVITPAFVSIRSY